MVKKYRSTSVFGWLRRSLAVVAVVGMFVASPVIAYAGGGDGSGSGQQGSNSQGDQGKGVPVPETPYAIILPVALLGAAYVVYRKRMKPE